MIATIIRSLLLALASLAAMPLHASGSAPSAIPAERDMAAYLMVYFKDETHGIHFALSSDGYRFTALNDDRPVLPGAELAEQKGVRDPHLMRGPDGAFYLAATDLHIYARREGLRSTEWERDGLAYGWGNNRGFALLRSADLLEWTRSRVRVDQAFPSLADIGCAWAPQTIYDERARRLMLYFTMRHGNGRNRLYHACVDAAFTKLETEPRLLFEYPKDISYIDGDITRVGDRFHLFYVPHDGTPGIKQAVSSSLNTGYAYDPAYYDPEPAACEAPSVWKRIGEEKWVLMYDIYGIRPHNFGFSETRDFKTFTNLGRFNQGVMKAANFSSPKHASVVHLTRAEARRLADHWKLSDF